MHVIQPWSHSLTPLLPLPLSGIQNPECKVMFVHHTPTHPPSLPALPDETLQQAEKGGSSSSGCRSLGVREYATQRMAPWHCKSYTDKLTTLCATSVNPPKTISLEWDSRQQEPIRNHLSWRRKKICQVTRLRQNTSILRQRFQRWIWFAGFT